MHFCWVFNVRRRVADCLAFSFVSAIMRGVCVFQKSIRTVSFPVEYVASQ